MATAPTDGQATASRFPLFDGLRALAALSILVFHASFDTGAIAGRGGLSPYLARLNVGVAVFFVISGFLLYRPMVLGRLSGVGFDAGRYALRRLLRIVPAYWVALTLLSAWPGLVDVRGVHWWVYYGFAQGYSYSTASNGIGPAWTLGCELVFYALLPFLSLGFGRLAAVAGRRVWWQLELGALLLLSSASALYGVYALNHAGAPQTTFAATFGWFALGMSLALVSALGAGARGAASDALARWSWLGWPAAGVAYLVMCRGLGLDGRFGYAAAQTPLQAVALDILSGIVAVGLTLPAVFQRRSSGLIARALGSRVLSWLGLVSYGIYLYHAPLLSALNRIDPSGSPAVRMLWLLPAGAAAAIAAGALSYYLVERPALARAHGRQSRVRTPALQPRWFGAAVPYLLAILVAAGVAAGAGHLGDYALSAHIGDNPAPVIQALLHGNFSVALSHQPVMGLTSILLRLPFVALSNGLGGGERLAYQLGTFACALVVALVCLAVTNAAARGRTGLGAAAVTALMLLNPLTFRALWWGHPEELLAGALCVGAVLASVRNRPLLAGALLGLALGTKEWTMLAIVPAVLSCPSGRRPWVAAATVLGVPLALAFPLLDPAAFARSAHMIGDLRLTTITSWWSPFAHGAVPSLPLGLTRSDVSWLVPLASIPLGWMYWRGRRRRDPADALGLLALLLLLRCVADPIAMDYYHVPFLMALVAWEVVARRGVPLVSLAAVAGIWATYARLDTSASAGAAAYIVVTVGLVWVLALGVLGRRTPARPASPLPATS